MTRRAEIALGRARLGATAATPVTSGAGDPTRHPAQPVDIDHSGDLYLLATDRPTGQPLPPEGPLGIPGPARADRPARLTVGLRGA
jgi:hypothetical protein